MRMPGIFMRSAARARAIGSDDRGQVLLLSGVMVFVVLMITIMTFDMSKAVYNRIIAQNSVDAAADAAALWQARGCNLLQHLNNVHYKVNETLFIAETAALTGCGLSVVTVPGEIATRPLIPTIFDWVWVAALASADASCNLCYTAPWIDWGQEEFAKVVMKVQGGIEKVFPVLAFLYADTMAKESGADDVFAAASSYVGTIASELGLDSSSMSGVSEELADGISGLPVNIYAFPIDPSALKLHVEKKAGTSLPWKWPDWAVAAGETAANIAAPLCNGDTMVSMVGQIDPGKPAKWGWADEFYWGNPGFMTWVAGKKSRTELLGIGNLNWFSGGKVDDAEMEVNSRAFYSPGSVRSGSSALTIPAFLAIASSQVEGEPVVSKGKADAKGKIITVFFPPESNPTTGEKFLIYH
ncbi:MAG: pilus assembly protein TadG-related protein [bacterium]